MGNQVNERIQVKLLDLSDSELKKLIEGPLKVDLDVSKYEMDDIEKDYLCYLIIQDHPRNKVLFELSKLKEK